MTSPQVKGGGDAGKEATDCLGVGSEAYRQNDEKQRKMKPEDSPRKEGRRTPGRLVSDLSRVHEESGWLACGGVLKNLVMYDAEAPLLKEVEGIVTVRARVAVTRVTDQPFATKEFCAIRAMAAWIILRCSRWSVFIAWPR